MRSQKICWEVAEHGKVPVFWPAAGSNPALPANRGVEELRRKELVADRRQEALPVAYSAAELAAPFQRQPKLANR